MVEDRPIMSVKYCLPVPSLSLLAKIITHPVVRSLCDRWASCWNSCCHRPTSNIMFRSVPYSCLRRLKNYTRSTMDQERLSSLSVCSIQCETANVLNNDTELYLSTNLRENMEGIHTFLMMLMYMYILIFGLTYCMSSIRISLYPVRH